MTPSLRFPLKAGGTERARCSVPLAKRGNASPASVPLAKRGEPKGGGKQVLTPSCKQGEPNGRVARFPSRSGETQAPPRFPSRSGGNLKEGGNKSSPHPASKGNRTGALLGSPREAGKRKPRLGSPREAGGTLRRGAIVNSALAIGKCPCAVFSTQRATTRVAPTEARRHQPCRGRSCACPIRMWQSYRKDTY